MFTQIDNFYLQQQEPNQSCLLALRDIVLAHDSNFTAEWKYNMPFFCYKGKMCCYLWVHSKLNRPFLGMIEGKHLYHPNLIFEDRAKIKVMIFDPQADLPVDDINSVLHDAIELYKNGVVKLRKTKG